MRYGGGNIKLATSLMWDSMLNPPPSFALLVYLYVKGNAMKIFNLFTVAVSVLFSVSPLTVSVNGVESNWGIAISQFTGESVGIVSRYEKTEDAISFVLNGEKFNFFMNEIDISNNIPLEGGVDITLEKVVI